MIIYTDHGNNHSKRVESNRVAMYVIVVMKHVEKLTPYWTWGKGV